MVFDENIDGTDCTPTITQGENILDISGLALLVGGVNLDTADFGVQKFTLNGFTLELMPWWWVIHTSEH